MLASRIAGVGFCLLAYACVWCAWCLPARADAANWTLHWRAPKPCPSERAVRETVQNWLAQSIEPSDPRGIAVDAVVTAKDDGFVLELELETPSGSGHERFLAQRCETLAGVVALKVALSADPGAWFNAVASDPARATRWTARVSASLASGALPSLGPTFDLTGGVRVSRVAFELGVGYALPSSARYPAHPSVGAELDLFYASPRLCVLPEMGDVEFPLCGGADLGLMRGVGVGTPQVSTSTQPYAALVVAPSLRLPITQRFSAWLGFEALVSVLRPSFHVRNLERLYRPETIGARIQLGGELHFE